MNNLNFGLLVVLVIENFKKSTKIPFSPQFYGKNSFFNMYARDQNSTCRLNLETQGFGYLTQCGRERFFRNDRCWNHSISNVLIAASFILKNAKWLIIQHKILFNHSSQNHFCCVNKEKHWDDSKEYQRLPNLLR